MNKVDNKNTTKKVFIGVMIATTIAKLLGFLKEITIASVYGMSKYVDAYILSMSIPMVLFSGIASALLLAYIPVNSQISEKYGKGKSIEFTSNLIKIIFVVFIIIIFGGILFSKNIVYIVGNNLDRDILGLTVRLTQINFGVIVFVAIVNIFTGFLQCNNNYIIPALSPIVYNSIFIIGIIGKNIWGMVGLAIANVIGVSVQALILYYFSKRIGYKNVGKINLKDKNLSKVIILGMPIFIGIFLQQFNTLIDKFLASSLKNGTIAALSYSNKLLLFVYGIISLSISNVIYPKLSNLNFKGNKEQYNNIVTSAISYIVLMVMPIMIYFMLFSNSIVNMLFQRGNFTFEDTIITAECLFFYSIGIIFWCTRDVLCRVYFSLQNSKTPMINGIIGSVINVVLNILLIKILKHKGIALATSVSAFLTTILLIIPLIINKKIEIDKSVVKLNLKYLVATVLTYYFFIFNKRFLIKNIYHYNILAKFWYLAFMFLVLLGVYYIILVVLRVEGMRQLPVTLKKIILKKIYSNKG